MSKNSVRAFKIAKAKTPCIHTHCEEGWQRHDVARLLECNDNIGIELGVAKGIFSKRMLESGKFKRFYGVDLYEDIHNTEEYINTLKYLDHTDSNYSLLRMNFDSALLLFEDNFFDFVYVDGFAHTGEEGGKTLINWLDKVKPGGILAGDDYGENWPLVVWAVNDLASKLGINVGLTTRTEEQDYCKYPTWWIKKPIQYSKPEVDPELYKLGMLEKARIHKKRLGSRRRKRMRMQIAKLLGFQVKKSH